MEKIDFPITQRRLRSSIHMRELTAAVQLSHKCMVQPLFVEENLSRPRDVSGLPYVQVDTIESIVHTVAADLENGVTKFLLFPVPASKSTTQFDFSFAISVVRLLRKTFGNDIWLAVDLCLCSYTTHGHCGILTTDHSRLINHQTVASLSSYALQLAAVGADCIAPSDMMDGRIAAIRTQLNAMQYDHVGIMSYAAKFSSNFYGPFRDACHSAPQTNGLQNRRTYQISPANPADALESAFRDEQEGADILMVKPAALYTDIIAALKQQTRKPVAAYHVSGEYAAVELLAQQGLLNRADAHLEVWTALQRSGASIIISYAARQAKEWIARQVL